MTADFLMSGKAIPIANTEEDVLETNPNSKQQFELEVTVTKLV